MSTAMTFIRALFAVISLSIGLVLATTFLRFESPLIAGGTGLAIGIALFGLLYVADRVFRGLHLRTLNTILLGLLIGSLVGWTLTSLLTSVLTLASLAAPTALISFIEAFIFITSVYISVLLTLHSADEIHLTIPFVKLKEINQKKKDLILDLSILSDTRLIDLAASGLLNSHLLLPRFVLKEVYQLSESSDESDRNRGKRATDVVKRLENIDGLDLRYIDTDFPEIKELSSKLSRLARLMDSHILTSDMNRIQQSTLECVDGVRVINLHLLANALKPITQSGETIQIKIQRYGKEPRQGVGYLEDGTMVVVNGGADFIGETIEAQVLSVKHTSSGRMIFCNAVEDGEEEYQPGNRATKSYYAMSHE